MDKIRRKLMATGLVAALLTTLLLPVTAQAAVTPKLNKKSVTLCAGKSTTLKVTNTKQKAAWSSKNKKVAAVTPKGKITAQKAGTTYITVKVDKKTAKCKVIVRAHKWKNAPEKGHYEKVKVGEEKKVWYKCPKCGHVSYSYEEYDEHAFNNFGHSGGIMGEDVIPIYENKWIVDKKAYKYCINCKIKK